MAYHSSGGGGGGGGSVVSVADSVLGGTATFIEVDLTSLPSDADLVVEYRLSVSSEGFAHITFNGDTGASDYNSVWARLDGNGNWTPSAGDGLKGHIRGPNYRSDSTSGWFTQGEGKIYDYDAAIYHSIYGEQGDQAGSGARVELWSGTHQTAEALTSIRFTTESNSFIAGSYVRVFATPRLSA